MNNPQQPRLTPIDEWEDEATAMLDGVEYDTELGLRMARDAIRVSNGELSDAEFHEKYHDEVLAEFGEDERPTKPEGFDDD
ncbi:4Fe-4S ferredoxin N-terminal domain-containing protein [Haloarcula rubripromontorii]|uniref:4Fe-4S ferredoxin iron-sulfur binding domain-containing protein n=1 Tax=Haloarcula rubripromontorii TaxID=1705562 RepID=A0A0N0BN53_9EURY|nr:4Fe-4S ferredoxin N-terminal domain-containing protein [Haloarcula rubripromontorii]KOX91823.1 hypothetical protein AMS69_17080 [Haloarcula rubripromontorii]NLV06325.1 hypothetical protein [Haloarcula rubripromontorii]